MRGSTDTISSLRGLASKLPKTKSQPMDTIREIMEKARGQSFSQFSFRALYHVKGVSEFEALGEKVRTVIYPPEFIYLFDVGQKRSAGFRMRYEIPRYDPRILVLGDPDFPDLGDHELLTVDGDNEGSILYPAVAGSLIVSFGKPTTVEEARKRLKGHAENVEELIGDLGMFSVSCRHFQEAETATQIESEVEGVKYAELNTTVRFVDFSPGWFLERLL